MISVVVTGRLMKSFGKVHGATFGASSPFDADPAARHEAQLAVRHDGFARLEPALDDCFLASRALDHNRAVFDRAVRFDHERVLALLADLDRRGRHDDGPGVVGERDRDVDELARPQPAIVVRERRP